MSTARIYTAAHNQLLHVVDAGTLVSNHLCTLCYLALYSVCVCVVSNHSSSSRFGLLTFPAFIAAIKCVCSLSAVNDPV